MRGKKLLPLSLSIAAISLLAVGFANIGLVANAATGGVQDEPQPQAPPTMPAEVANVSEAVVLEVETPAAAPTAAVKECPCDNPGDCGIEGCPAAACGSTDCTVLHGEGACACGGSGCDRTDCTAFHAEGGCPCR